MTGFFSKKETQSKTRPDGRVYSCASCGLYKNANSPRMKPFGNFKKGILNIGEVPGQTEDERGKQWQGKSGRLLKRTYAKFGIDLFEDCLNINAINCRAIDNKGNNRNPSNYEVDCCRQVIISKIIKEYQPSVIVLLGSSALYSILGNRWKKDLGGINKWRGFVIPDQNYKCWICPVFHPSYVERFEEEEIKTIWEQDLKNILQYLDKPFLRHSKPRIHIIEDLSLLNNIKSENAAFDYETTGLKPYAKGHRIICGSIAVSKNLAYAFMIPGDRKSRQPLINFLENQLIGKIAANIKFEDTWTKIRLKTNVMNWEWDTMLAAHVLDNRRGVTGLKFQVYVNFGIVDYSSEIEPYLKSVDGNSNSLNRVPELIKTEDGKKKLLTYCGLDSIYEYRLAMKQMKIINYTGLPF